MTFWAGSSLCRVSSNAGVHGALPLPAGEVTSHISLLRPQERRRLPAILRDRHPHMVLCVGPPLVRVGVHSYVPPDSSLGSIWGP